MKAIELIAAERQRQIEVEGWTPEHDAKHTEGELADAACAYAMTDSMVSYIDENWGNDMYLHFWPFELDYLKKDDTGDNEKRIRDLTKAGALIVAEIERLIGAMGKQKKLLEAGKCCEKATNSKPCCDDCVDESMGYASQYGEQAANPKDNIK